MRRVCRVGSVGTMKALATCSAHALGHVRYLLSDIDDTLTDDGRVGATTYSAIHRLAAAGIAVVPVTGRPAGWCDAIARMWPVAAVVGENGACHYRLDSTTGRMMRHHLVAAELRAAYRRRYESLARTILEAVRGALVAADQPYRIADLAIDVAEDVPRLDGVSIRRIVGVFVAAGASAKVSSIHVNGWYGEHDKLTTSMHLLETAFGLRSGDIDGCVAFIGDSPDDAPMFARFPLSFGVANVREYNPPVAPPPAFATSAPRGADFVDLAEALLGARPR